MNHEVQFKPRGNKRGGPESILQEAIIDKLKLLDWYVLSTHGNIYQMGFPDIYATHVSYGIRWIEVKNPVAYSFTPAQLIEFPKLSANGTGIWILISDSDEEIKKLFQPPNWVYYLQVWK